MAVEDDVGEPLDLLPQGGVCGLAQSGCAVAAPAGDGHQDVVPRPAALSDDCAQLTEIDFELSRPLLEGGAVALGFGAGLFPETD